MRVPDATMVRLVADCSRCCYQPNGPLIWTVCGGITLRGILCFDEGGASTESWTSGGNERGADPIREVHLEEVENVRGATVKAGTKKSGSATVLRDVERTRLPIALGNA